MKRQLLPSQQSIRYALLCTMLLMMCQWTTAENFYYKRYDVTMHVHTDNTYSVQETMDAFFTEESHGILRYMPNECVLKRQLPGENGGTVERLMHYPVELEDVKVSEEYELSTDGEYEIRIGNPDKLVMGDHHYQINYTYKVGNDRTPCNDLFYYSLLGADNAASVDTFTFAVHFDKKIPEECQLRFKLMYGEAGDSIDRCRGGQLEFSDSLISGQVYGLDSYQAVTVFLPLPEGYFTCDGQSVDSGTRNMWVCVVIAICLLAIVLVRECKRRNNFTKVIECWPPEDLSSADIGYIYDREVDTRDIISLIPYFAHKGLLTIDTTTGHPILHKKGEIDKDAPQGQLTLFNALFEKGNAFDIKQPPKSFDKKWSKMMKAIQQDNSDMQNEYAWKHILLYFLSGLVALFGLLHTSDITQSGSLPEYCIIAALELSFTALTSLFLWDASSRSRIGRFFLLATWALDIGLLLVQLSSISLDEELYLLPGEFFAIQLLFVVYLFGAIFMMRLTNMSKKRLELIGHILGLHEFIEKSEKPLLDSLCREHEKYFYDILPYAVAFGLQEKWAKQFEGLHVAPADWYEGKDQSLTGLCYWMNTSHLCTPAMNGNTGVHSSSSSSFSSFSSGGFSGGGFGGGGSSSW